MSEERDKVRCRSCELVQWSDRANCRRCGNALPEPIVRIVERVVERVVIRQDAQCLQKLEEASRLISTATERLPVDPRMWERLRRRNRHAQSRVENKSR